MRRYIVLAAFCAALLGGCGWHLRGFNQYSMLDELNLVADNRFGPMALAVRDAMRQYSVAQSDTAAWRLELGEEELRRRTVAVTSIGSASQYELTLRIPFLYRSSTTDEVQLPQVLQATRVYDFDFRNTVAKTEEEQVLVQEMRNELAHRILQYNPEMTSHGAP